MHSVLYALTIGKIGHHPSRPLSVVLQPAGGPVDVGDADGGHHVELPLGPHVQTASAAAGVVEAQTGAIRVESAQHKPLAYKLRGGDKI